MKISIDAEAFIKASRNKDILECEDKIREAQKQYKTTLKYVQKNCDHKIQVYRRYHFKQGLILDITYEDTLCCVKCGLAGTKDYSNKKSYAIYTKLSEIKDAVTHEIETMNCINSF